MMIVVVWPCDALETDGGLFVWLAGWSEGRKTDDVMKNVKDDDFDVDVFTAQAKCMTVIFECDFYCS